MAAPPRQAAMQTILGQALSHDCAMAKCRIDKAGLHCIPQALTAAYAHMKRLAARQHSSQQIAWCLALPFISPAWLSALTQHFWPPPL